MKITSVELHPESSSYVAILSFRDPARENPYNVRSIEGLDADTIIRRYYGSSTGDVKFYDLTLDKREIVVKIDLNPRFSLDETYASLRDDLYKTIASSRTGVVQLQFKNGTAVSAAVSGFITKFEAPLFDKTPGVQITIECDDPLPKALTRTSVSVGGLNPALTVIQDAISTARHGFLFELGFTGAVASLVITDPTNPVWSFEVTPGGGFLNGDVLHFSSEFNNKYLYVVRGGVTIYLGDVIQPGSIWPILFPGNNSFAIASPTLLHWNLISHYATYWGV